MHSHALGHFTTEVAVIVMLVAVCPASAAPAEPEGLWSGTMTGDTPTTLKGAQVLDLPALEALMARKPVLVDSGPADRKPENLAAGSVWKPMHRSIPGAAWFPGAGLADLPAEKAASLLRRVDELTHGDKSVSVVSFCQPRCWGSWNVGKRLVQAGYSAVYWFPGGINAWQERNGTTAVQPEDGWGGKP